MFSIGVDSGTQSTKVLIVDFESGRIVGRGQAPHAMIPGLKPGESEQDPDVWIRAFEEALKEALAEARIDPGQVRALGVSGQQHGFVPLDAAGCPIRPAKLWNDTSTVAENEALLDALGGTEAAIEKLGLAPAVGFTASKILWLKRHEPAAFARLATVLLPHNYINFKLTGRACMEYGDASGTGLMDIRTRRWHPEAVAAVDASLGAKLPALDHPLEPIGPMKGGIAAAFGFKDVLVSSGGGDNMMGAIGTGNVSPGVCTVSLGTSGTVYAYFDRPFSDPKGEIAAFCDSTGGWLPLLCTMNVTNTTELWKSILDVDNVRLDTRAAAAPAGADGLLFLPFIDGERVPVLPQAKGVFFGLDRATFGAAHMSRAVMEGASSIWGTAWDACGSSASARPRSGPPGAEARAAYGGKSSPTSSRSRSSPCTRRKRPLSARPCRRSGAGRTPTDRRPASPNWPRRWSGPRPRPSSPTRP